MPPCPRCGHRQPLGQQASGVCVYCGQFLATVDWIAGPPGGYQVPAPRVRPRYTGPPSYPVPPRWGFPLVTWRRPTSFEPAPVNDRLRARALAGTAQPLLWLAAAISLLTAGVEGWRYALLLDSRTDALPADPLRTSDALVVTGGVVSVLACAVAGLVTLAWVLRAYPAASELAGIAPSRSPRELLIGWLVPGVNLFVPGSTLAEIEHAVLGRPPQRRPIPSPLIRVWWAAWSAGVVLAGVTLLWSLRDSTQALADGVVLHAVVDVLAAITAALTAVVVRSLTTLMEPAATGRPRRMIVVRIGSDESARDRQGGEPADDEFGASDRRAGQPQPG
jgi:Domain of unknown function (DUF4328)